MKRKSFKQAARGFLDDFVEDDVLTLAAAVAYSATLAIAPLLVLMLAILGSLGPELQDSFADAFAGLVGASGRELLEEVMRDAARKPDWRELGGWISAGLLVVAASAVFAQLQGAVNRIWELEAPSGGGVWRVLRRRLFSVGVLLALLFLTLLAQVTQFALQQVSLPEPGATVWSWLLATAVYTVLFGALYRWLPDGRLPWPTVMRAGLITALLFQLGHALVVTYLTRADPGAAFGAGSALVIWLLWSFYSALIFLASAELVSALAQFRAWQWFAKPARPLAHAK